MSKESICGVEPKRKSNKLARTAAIGAALGILTVGMHN